jgi:hypothetical protein
MFRAGDRLLRAVFNSGRRDYEHLISSGLYNRLVGRDLLIPHEEVADAGSSPPGCWRVLQPERLPFISYASEWSFSQLKDAASTVLATQAEALAHGMMLKDAPTANVQFRQGKPILIDTLSFVRADTAAWPAYFQFCKHFVAPLVLAAYGMDRALKWVAVEADGIPLEAASRLLPWRSWSRPLSLWHLHLHARANTRSRSSDSPPKQAVGEGGGAPAQPVVMRPVTTASNATEVSSGPRALKRQVPIIDSLRHGIDGLSWRPPDTEWSRYNDERPTYNSEAWDARLTVVRRVLEQLKPAVVWDFGMAAGHFSREASAAGAFTVGFDADLSCVEKAYLEARGRNDARFLPLVQDLLRPSGPGGWAEAETLSLSARGPADLLLVLGLSHHLAIPGGVPLEHQLEYFTRLGKAVLFELVPDTDPVPQGSGLDRARFESSVLPRFDVMEAVSLPSSARALYLVRAR